MERCEWSITILNITRRGGKGIHSCCSGSDEACMPSVQVWFWKGAKSSTLECVKINDTFQRSNLRDFGVKRTIRINCLPHGEDTIDHSVMKHKHWVECRICDPAHVSTISNEAVNGVMDRFYGVVIVWVWIGDPGFITELGVVGVVGQQIVETSSKCCSAVSKLLSHQFVL